MTRAGERAVKIRTASSRFLIGNIGLIMYGFSKHESNLMIHTAEHKTIEHSYIGEAFVERVEGTNSLQSTCLDYRCRKYRLSTNLGKQDNQATHCHQNETKVSICVTTRSQQPLRKIHFA